MVKCLVSPITCVSSQTAQQLYNPFSVCYSGIASFITFSNTISPSKSFISAYSAILLSSIFLCTAVQNMPALISTTVRHGSHTNARTTVATTSSSITAASVEWHKPADKSTGVAWAHSHPAGHHTQLASADTTVTHALRCQSSSPATL